MRRHPALTVKILERVGAFRDLAATAGAHHERLDGGGYHLGLTGDMLNRDARILAVADVCEALTAERPYRAALPLEQVRAIMRRDAPHALCPEALGALEASQELGVADRWLRRRQRCRWLADHLEARVERGQREQPLDRPAAAHDDETAAVTGGAPLQREHAAEAGRVEEVERPQVEHDAARLGLLQPAHLRVERVGPAEVELAAEGDAHSVRCQALDGDPKRLIHAVHSPLSGAAFPCSEP